MERERRRGKAGNLPPDRLDLIVRHFPGVLDDAQRWLHGSAFESLLEDMVKAALIVPGRFGPRPTPTVEQAQDELHHLIENVSREREKLLATAAAAAYLGVGESTLRTWHLDGHGPPHTLVDGHRRYRPADLDAFTRPPRHHRFSGSTVMRTAVAAAYLGIHPVTLRKWAITGKAPPSLTLGKWTVYHRDDLDAFKTSAG